MKDLNELKSSNKKLLLKLQVKTWTQKIVHTQRHNNSQQNLFQLAFIIQTVISSRLNYSEHERKPGNKSSFNVSLELVNHCAAFHTICIKLDCDFSHSFPFTAPAANHSTCIFNRLFWTPAQLRLLIAF
jgi:hypothetical protein